MRAGDKALLAAPSQTRWAEVFIWQMGLTPPPLSCVKGQWKAVNETQSDKTLKCQRAMKCLGDHCGEWYLLQVNGSYLRLVKPPEGQWSQRCWWQYTFHCLATASDLSVISRKKGSGHKKKNTFLHNCPSLICHSHSAWQTILCLGLSI